MQRVINVATGKNKNANSEEDNIYINQDGKVYLKPGKVAEILNQYYINVPCNTANVDVFLFFKNLTLAVATSRFLLLFQV